MEKVDRTHWERAELFEFFSAVSHPFYSVTFRVDVTNLYRYVKERHLSFYYAMGYLVTDAVNSVKNFRYAIRDGEVWLLDERIPSLTDLKPGSEQFHIVTLPKVGGIAEFCASAQARSAAQKTLLDQDEENDNLIYISCTPWYDLTGCTTERDFDRDDNIPRITWGKYVRQENAGADKMELEKYTLGSLRRAVFEGDTTTGSLMAGQVAGMLHEVRPVADILADLWNGGRQRIAALSTEC